MGRNCKYRYLTKTQKELASKNFPLVIWFVRTMLSKKRIRYEEIEEVTDHVMWKFAIAAENFKKSRGVKFSSYAYRAMMSGLKRYEELRNRYNLRFKVVTFQASEDCEEYNPYSNLSMENSYRVDAEYLAHVISKVNLNDFERQVLFYCYELGYSLAETAEVLSYSSERIRQIRNSAVEKIHRFVERKKIHLRDFVDEVR